jgi:sugar phosphate isomerase/epimerase
LSALALTAWPSGTLPRAQTRPDLTYRGVKLGLITGTLNPLPTVPGRDPIDIIIEQCLRVGVAHVELVSVFEPWGVPPVVRGGRFGQPPDVVTPEYRMSREALRKWRLAQPLTRFEEVRKKFADAGLNLFSYVFTVGDDMSDTEIDAVFRQMQALAVRIFTSNQTRVGMARKISEFAEKYQIMPAYHPHAQVQDPNEIATAESLEKLLAMSPLSRVNLDIGHFTAGNQDAVAFIKKHHDRVTHLHVKDRRRNGGPNVRLGTGDTPIRECLQLIRDNKWDIICALEREFRGEGSSVDEQMDYMRQCLA